MRGFNKIPHFQDSEDPQDTKCPDNNEVFCTVKKETKIQGKNRNEINQAYKAEEIFQGFLYTYNSECEFNAE